MPSFMCLWFSLTSNINKKNSEATWNYSKSKDWSWEFRENTCSERGWCGSFKKRKGYTKDGEGASREEGWWGILLFCLFILIFEILFLKIVCCLAAWEMSKYQCRGICSHERRCSADAGDICFLSIYSFDVHLCTGVALCLHCSP